MLEEVESAEERMECFRNLQMDKALTRVGGNWMAQLITEPCNLHKEADAYIKSVSRLAFSVAMNSKIHACLTGSAR